MSSSGGKEHRDRSSAGVSGRAIEAEKARLARYIERIGKHRRALDLAIEEGFGGSLEPKAWEDAFESTDPHDANRTMVVTGDHSAVLNSYVEVLRASTGSRLIGLLPHRRPRAEQVFDAVRDDGGLTEGQTELLHRMYVLEGRLEHASPDIDAEEVREAIEELRQVLPKLLEQTRAWLKRHGIALE